MRKIVSIALLAVQGALVFFSYTTANPIAIITSSIISIGIGGANIAQMNTGKGTAGMLNPDLILDQNGNKIYKNTSDYLKRMVDMYEKIIKALEDYKRKNG